MLYSSIALDSSNPYLKKKKKGVSIFLVLPFLKLQFQVRFLFLKYYPIFLFHKFVFLECSSTEFYLVQISL